MADIKFTSVPSKRLSASITASGSTLKLNNIKGWDDADLVAGDFGSLLYAVLRNDANTIMELIELDPSTIADDSITINKRGLKFDGDLTTEVSGNKKTWVKNETIVELGSNPPQLLNHIVRTIGAQTIAGVKTFSGRPKTTAGDPVADTDLARKKYVDDTITAGAPNASKTVKGIAEEATTAETDAGTPAGGTSARLFVNPDGLASSIYKTQLPSSGQKAALVGTQGTPSGSNKYVTETDTGVVKTTGNQTVGGVKTFSSIPILPSSNPTADNQAVRKKYVDDQIIPTPANFVVGDQLLQSADTNRTETSTSYVKKKEIRVGRVFGALRIKFDLSAQSPGDAGDRAFGLIYRNGSPIGTERTVVIVDGRVTFSQDISGWEIGDLIQMYIKKEGVLTNVNIQNFRLYVNYLEAPEVITD